MAKCSRNRIRAFLLKMWRNVKVGREKTQFEEIREGAKQLLTDKIGCWEKSNRMPQDGNRMQADINL